jgi:hypothetical protein
MLKIFDQYSPNANPANTAYPHGSGKDESVAGANDGTPLEMDWYNDVLGYSEALLAEAGVVPSGSADTALTSDRMDAFRIAAMRVETAVAYNGGDVSRVGVIALVTGENVTNYDYIVDGDSLTRWEVGSVTGTFAGDFNSTTGVDSGLSGALLPTDTLASYVGGKTIVTGSAVFDNTDNSITLVGIGVGIELGDVVTVTGSTNNSKLFTVDEITSTGKIIVNKAHANKTWTAENKSLFSETTGVTVKLLCKWYLARDSLGRGWVEIGATRLFNTTYQISGNRSVKLNVSAEANADVNMSITVGGVVMSGSISRYNGSGLVRSTASATIPSGVNYVVNVTPTNAQKFNWSIFA